MALKNEIGSRFGKLLVVGRAENDKSGTVMWHCVCDCGGVRIVAGTGLRSGRNKSCGCASPRFAPGDRTTHGMSRTRTYRIWRGMLVRCSEKATGKGKRLYFDKGVRVCDRWKTFENFVQDMGIAPDGLSIDRIDGNGNYEPGNCRWASSAQQANNTSANHLIEFDGVVLTVSEWASHIGVQCNTLLYRIKRGIPLDRAMAKDIGFKSKIEAEKRKRNCLVCGGSFIPRAASVKAGYGLYCSQACNGASRAMQRKNETIGMLVND